MSGMGGPYMPVTPGLFPIALLAFAYPREAQRSWSTAYLHRRAQGCSKTRTQTWSVSETVEQLKVAAFAPELDTEPLSELLSQAAVSIGTRAVDVLGLIGKPNPHRLSSRRGRVA